MKSAQMRKWSSDPTSLPIRISKISELGRPALEITLEFRMTKHCVICSGGQLSRRVAVSEFVTRYNEIVEDVETDPSLKIEFKQ